MTYKLNPALRLIRPPVVLVRDGQEWEYPDGKALMEFSCEKNYLIESIVARGERVVIAVKGK